MGDQVNRWFYPVVLTDVEEGARGNPLFCDVRLIGLISCARNKDAITSFSFSHTAAANRHIVSYLLGMDYAVWSKVIPLCMGGVYAGCLVVKLGVNLLAKSKTKWDRLLYRGSNHLSGSSNGPSPPPATLYDQNGMTIEDGISNPNGNSCDLLMFWDVLHGTGKIRRRTSSNSGRVTR